MAEKNNFMKWRSLLAGLCCLLILASCNYYNESKVRKSGGIIQSDNSEFREKLLIVIEEIRSKGNKVIKVEDYKRQLTNAFNTDKKSFKIVNKQSGAEFSLQFYTYNNLEGSNIATERLYTKLGNIAELPNTNKAGMNKPIFGVLNNYSITILEYQCRDEAAKSYSNTLIPLLYQNLKKADSKILNLLCDAPLVR